MDIRKRLPTLAQIAPVYALLGFMIYTWTIFRFFWKLPSWLYHASLDRIGILYAYMVSVNFLESLLVLLGLVALAFILPRRWFLDHFVTKGLLLTLLGLGYWMFLAYNMQAESDFPINLLRLSPIAAVVVLAAAFLLDKVGFVRTVLEKLAENLVIFLYLLIPASVISVLVILIRNLF